MELQNKLEDILVGLPTKEAEVLTTVYNSIYEGSKDLLYGKLHPEDVELKSRIEAFDFTLQVKSLYHIKPYL